MASTAQIIANRANARLSTGPVTPEGKAACRFNATRHGLAGSQVVVPGENPAHYDALRQALLDELRPASEAESALADQIAQNWWRLQRARRIEAQILEKYGEIECFTEPEAVKAFQSVTRYLARIERAWNQARRDLAKLQAERRECESFVLPLTPASAPQPRRPELPFPIGSVSQPSHPNDSLPLACRL